MKPFNLGDKVTVSAIGGWKKESTGVVVGGPERIETLQGPENYFWVEFDIPQQAIDGDETYTKAQILSCYLSA